MGWFKRDTFMPLKVDMHSHLIPTIDDGSPDMTQSIDMILQMQKLGYQKLITTPHIHPRYPNTPAIIQGGLEKLQKEVQRRQIDMELEAAAEYFVDDQFYKKVKSGDSLLSFADGLVLIETSFLNKPVFFETIVFELQSKGYRPILAHPERYRYLEEQTDWLEELKTMGVLFQVTVSSLVGYYGDAPQKMARRMIKNELVDFLGSDIHRMKHLPFLEKGLRLKEVQRFILEKANESEALL